MGLIARSVESLEDSLSLLSEIIATFEVNRNRLKWTEQEFRELYRFYEHRWKPRYDQINGSAIKSSTDDGGGK